jgi:stress-induced morphogen
MVFAAPSIQAAATGAPAASSSSSSLPTSSSRAARVVVVARALPAPSAPSTSGRASRTQLLKFQQQPYAAAPTLAPSSSSRRAAASALVARAADPSGAPEGQISAALMESMRAKIGEVGALFDDGVDESAAGTTQRAVPRPGVPPSAAPHRQHGPPAANPPRPPPKTHNAQQRQALETDQVTVQDVNGDGRHVEIDVTSALFEGKTPVQRQRLVYKAIWEELQGAVHAVDAMATRAPGE